MPADASQVTLITLRFYFFFRFSPLEPLRFL